MRRYGQTQTKPGSDKTNAHTWEITDAILSYQLHSFLRFEAGYIAPLLPHTQSSDCSLTPISISPTAVCPCRSNCNKLKDPQSSASEETIATHMCRAEATKPSCKEQGQWTRTATHFAIRIFKQRLYRSVLPIANSQSSLGT
jgi:hypothetical protein